MLNWGAFTFATFLQAMRRRVSVPLSPQLGFWPFLLWWSYEYLPAGRLDASSSDYAYPRAVMWSRPPSRRFELTDARTLRAQLELVYPTDAVWHPFLDLVGQHDLMHEFQLSFSRLPVYSVYSWELYMGDHCWRQLARSFMLPGDPPRATF